MARNTTDLTDFAAQLRQKNLRATPIRQTMLKILSGSQQPLAIGEIQAALLKHRFTQFDIATLYRNVITFKKAGLVTSVDVGAGREFYEYVSPSTAHHHHHVICESCRRIEHLDVCGIEPHLKMLEKMGYQRLQHRLEFSGLCRNCA